MKIQSVWLDMNVQVIFANFKLKEYLIEDRHELQLPNWLFSILNLAVLIKKLNSQMYNEPEHFTIVFLF